MNYYYYLVLPLLFASIITTTETEATTGNLTEQQQDEGLSRFGQQLQNYQPETLSGEDSFDYDGDNPLGVIDSPEFKNLQEAMQNIADVEYVMDACNLRIVIQNDLDYMEICDEFNSNLNAALNAMFSQNEDELNEKLFGIE